MTNTNTYDPKTAPMVTAERAIADAPSAQAAYLAINSAARFHEGQTKPRRLRDGTVIPANPASMDLAKRLRRVAREIAELGGVDVATLRGRRGRRAANDNSSKRVAA